MIFLLIFIDICESEENYFFEFNSPSDTLFSVHWGPKSNELYFNTIEEGKGALWKLDIVDKNLSLIGEKNTDYILLDINLTNGTLLVSSYEDSEKIIFLSKEGKILQTLPVKPIDFVAPMFSPDGRWIAHTKKPLELKNRVYLYDIERNMDYPIKNYILINFIEDWSINNELLYISYEEKKEGNYSYSVNFNLYSYDINKKQSKQITNFTNCQNTDNSIYPSNPKWSPDGEKIVCSITTSKSNHETLAILDKYGNILRLFEFGSANQSFLRPIWSPDGKKIAFIIAESVEGQDYPKYSLALIELDPSLQSGPRPEKIPEIKLVTFNIYLYGGIAIGMLLLAIAGFLFIRRKK